MSKNNPHIFTSESVGEGHPDKVADYISDSILDACLAQDKTSRVACETLVKSNMVIIAGELTTKAVINPEKIARQAIREIGYCNRQDDDVFHADTVFFTNLLTEQSPDIAMGVDNAYDDGTTGAGDQGMMFGFACDETPEYMPTAIAFAHRLTRRLTEVRKNGTLPWLRPDGKAQVTIAYEDGQPVAVDTIVISTQHNPEIAHADIYAAMMEHVIRPVIPAEMLTADTRYLINPTGRFVIGGPAGDSGLTGRKIIVDTYGGYAPHGGGAFSGKDPTKVDRSAAYAARHIAKNIVAAGLAKRCEIQLAYAIGVARPVSLFIDTMGTGVVSDDKLAAAVDKLFDLRPNAIIQRLNLRRPIYRANCNYGHFGKADMPWEQLDYVNALRREILE